MGALRKYRPRRRLRREHLLIDGTLETGVRENKMVKDCPQTN